jgi:hypothetical protein
MKSNGIISPEEIFNAYNKHGEDFLIIDLNSIKEYGMKTVKYFDIKIRKEDGKEIVPKIKFMKLLLASKIKPPTERDYEKLKIAIRRDDELNQESLFGKAMELICNTFTKKVKDMKASGIINDDEEDDNNTPNVVIVPSCKPQTPLQKSAKDKDGVLKKFDNPMLWFGLNYNDKAPTKTLDFTYKIDDSAKFKVKEFDIDIYDTEKIMNKKLQLAEVDGELVTNYNIDKFVTMKSVLSGLVYMQVKASKQSFNLNTKIYNALYVKSNKYTEYSTHLFNEDELNDICGDVQSTVVPSTKKEEVETKSESEEEVDDDNGSIDDEINNLKFT